MAESAFFLESTYEEAYDLLIETRDYIEKRMPEIRRHASQAYKMVISVETMRLTTRLTQVMAWLLTQKAVFLEFHRLSDGAERTARRSASTVAGWITRSCRSSFASCWSAATASMCASTGWTSSSPPPTDAGAAIV